MSLYILLKNFCIEAYRELVMMNELPRPPYDSLIIARNPIYTVRLSEMDSYKQLQQYMRNSGLSKRLHDIGHTWIWHEEVFHWLFLERVLAESRGESLDRRVFQTVYRRAQAELSRPTFTLRRIMVLNGVPQLKRRLLLSPHTYLRPIEFSVHHYEIGKLLSWAYHDKNRAPSFWLDPRCCLLIQDRIIKKGNEGKDLLNAREERRHQVDLVVKALRLSINSPVFVKSTFASYLSCFPLLPIAFEETEEFRDISIEVGRDITRREVQDIKTHFDFISSSEPAAGASEQFFNSALDRFSASFRFRDIQQSIIDLIVALEALFPVGEELRYRLAVSVASLLGTNDRERQRFFRSTYAGYKLRNAIVHGRGNQAKNMANALKELFPELEGKTNSEVNKHIGGALKELQFIVRKTLRAYITLKISDSQASWPTADDYDYLLFDLERCHQIQKQLGIKTTTEEVPDFKYWKAIG